MTGNNDIHRAEVLADGLRGPVDGPVAGVDIGQVDYGIITVGQHGDNGVDIFIPGVGLFVDVIEAEAHIAHGKGDIVAVGVSRVTADDLSLRNIYNVGALVPHGLCRLICESLIMPRGVAEGLQIVFKIGNMLIFFIVIRRIAVHQIACVSVFIRKGGGRNLGYAADMV